MYNTGIVTGVTGINRKTLHYWVKTGLVGPSIEHGEGTGNYHQWSFRDIVELRVICSLREKGVSLQKLREVRELLHGNNPLAEWLVIAGSEDVYLVSGDRLLSLIQQPGQSSLMLVNIEEAHDEVKRQLRNVV